jgi:hypothetical protein
VGLRIFYPPRRNHSFGVCALARLGTTIGSSLGRAPSEIPLPRAAGFSVGCGGVLLGRLGQPDVGFRPQLRRISLPRTPLNRASRYARLHRDEHRPVGDRLGPPRALDSERSNHSGVSGRPPAQGKPLRLPLGPPARPRILRRSPRESRRCKCRSPARRRRCPRCLPG